MRHANENKPNFKMLKFLILSKFQCKEILSFAYHTFALLIRCLEMLPKIRKFDIEETFTSGGAKDHYEEQLKDFE